MFTKESPTETSFFKLKLDPKEPFGLSTSESYKDRFAHDLPTSTSSSGVSKITSAIYAVGAALGTLIIRGVAIIGAAVWARRKLELNEAKTRAIEERLKKRLDAINDKLPKSQDPIKSQPVATQPTPSDPISPISGVQTAENPQETKTHTRDELLASRSQTPETKPDTTKGYLSVLTEMRKAEYLAPQESSNPIGCLPASTKLQQDTTETTNFAPHVQGCAVHKIISEHQPELKRNHEQDLPNISTKMDKVTENVGMRDPRLSSNKQPEDLFPTDNIKRGHHKNPELESYGIDIDIRDQSHIPTNQPSTKLGSATSGNGALESDKNYKTLPPNLIKQ